MKKKIILCKNLLLILFFISSAATLNAQELTTEEAKDFTLTEVGNGFDIPWGMTFVTNNQLLISQKTGGISLLDINTGNATTVSTAPNVNANRQAGLMDIKKSPDFDTTGWVYFTYSKKIGHQSATTLARARFSNNQLNDWNDLFTSNLLSKKGIHFGSRIAFDEQQHIFITHGERGERENAQNLSNHGGTVIRLNLDGTVPADNPFANTPNARAEIWSYGHRNPQGIAYDSAFNQLWTIEHGPRGGDEINLIHAGKNYGWPIISYGKEYMLPKAVGESTHKEGLEQPVKYYVPSIAPSSLLLYSGKAFKQWRGNLFAGALKLTHLNRIVIDENNQFMKEERLLGGLKERIRNVTEGPQGWIYISADSGRILELKPKAQSQ